jgi:DNA polymerase-3 subunit gamma/tau
MRDAEPPPADLDDVGARLSAREAVAQPWEDGSGLGGPGLGGPGLGPAPPLPLLDDVHTSRWLQLVQPLLSSGKLSGLVRELAWQSQCLACTGDEDEHMPLRITLRVQRESLRQTPLRDRLQAQLSELHGGGRAVAIEVQAGTVQDSAALRDAVAKSRRQSDAEALVHGHARVLALLARFPGAFVVPGSIRPL